MKKILTLICASFLAIASYAYEPNVNEAVLKSFKETFVNAEEIKWEEYKTYYTVSFVQSGIRSKVNYDKEGTMLGSIRYYDPNMLPLNILSKMKKQHAKKEMFGVTEVTFGNDVIYYIKMQDAKFWTTIKVDASGNSEVFEKYKKG